MNDPKKTFDDLANKIVREIIFGKNAPGFIIGLSGTDSVLTYMLLREAVEIAKKKTGKDVPVWGIHYVPERTIEEKMRAKKRGSCWFEETMIPWLMSQHEVSKIDITTPLGYYSDQHRWADLMLRSVKKVSRVRVNDTIRIKSDDLPEGENYWVVGTINATEKALGKYSIFANAVSFHPIQSLWKSEVLDICQAIGVPSIAIENSKIPDCLCGRDELAAHNIYLLDRLIRGEETPDSEIVRNLLDYIEDAEEANGFKTEIPYVV